MAVNCAVEMELAKKSNNTRIFMKPFAAQDCDLSYRSNGIECAVVAKSLYHERIEEGALKKLLKLERFVMKDRFGFLPNTDS